jgi:hypothetical protein
MNLRNYLQRQGLICFLMRAKHVQHLSSGEELTTASHGLQQFFSLQQLTLPASAVEEQVNYGLSGTLDEDFAILG